MFSSMVENFQYWTNTYWDEYGDPRMKGQFFMTSFQPVSFVLLSYAAYVLVVGPKIMRKRPAQSLRRSMLCYNALMTLLNMAMFVQIVANFKLFSTLMFDVQFPQTYELTDSVRMVIRFNYFFGFTKMIDLLDTIFFVQRKKFSQITFLHVYHHFSVPFWGWMYFRLNALLNTFLLFAFMNTFIHSLMYAYYGLSALGPVMRPYLWWKRYITQLQITQFVILAFYSAYFFFYQQGYKPFFLYNYLANSALYLVLFAKFYIYNYTRTLDKKAIKANSQ